MASGRAPDRTDPPLTPIEVRSQRRLFGVAAVAYVVWWFIGRAVAPGSYDPFAGRVVVTALFVAALAASVVDHRIARRLNTVFAACAWALTGHYYYLLHRNHGDMPWAVGAYVVAVAVGACLPSRRSLLAYSTLTLVLGCVVSLVDRALLHTIFLPGLATMTFLSNLTLHQRLLLGVERAERIQADAARTSAEAGVALRDEFISIASHELRTPLAALQLAVQGLSRAARRADGPPSADLLDRTLETCQRQTARLSRLVDALLDTSRITKGRFVLAVEDVPLVALVRDVAQMLAGDAARAGSSITIDGGAEVCGRWDRMRLEQLVSNLLRNAITFGLGRPIRVTVTAGAEAARLAVADQGIGIARADQARIFGRFERAVSSTNYGGMGIGLYVVSQIVAAHGGEAHVESEPGQGATFVVDLPLMCAVASARGGPPERGERREPGSSQRGAQEQVAGPRAG